MASIRGAQVHSKTYNPAPGAVAIASHLFVGRDYVKEQVGDFEFQSILLYDDDMMFINIDFTKSFHHGSQSETISGCIDSLANGDKFDKCIEECPPPSFRVPSVEFPLTVSRHLQTTSVS